MWWMVDRCEVPARGQAPAAGEVQLWAVQVTEHGNLAALLDRDERHRAAAFVSQRARTTFLASRGAQRLVMAHYLDRPPAKVRISRTCRHCGHPDHGRPEADGGPDYSVAHSGDWVIIAVVGGSGPVGVDLERARAHTDIELVADTVFAPAERDMMRQLPPSDRAGFFYRTWARKEAVAKSTGRGLVVDLGTLDVGAATVPLPGAEQRHVRDLPAPPGYAAAIATTTPVRDLRFCRPQSW